MADPTATIDRLYADGSGVEAVVGLLDHADPEVRAAAAHALGGVLACDGAEPGAADAVVDALVARLADGDADVRTAAAWALGSMQAGRAVVALSAVAEQPGVGVAATAALLAMPSSQVAPTVHVDDVVEALLRLAARSDRRPAALKALLRHGRRGLVACLGEATSDEASQLAPWVASIGPAALPPLAACLDHPRRRGVALAALRALGELASPVVGAVDRLLDRGTDGPDDEAALAVLVAAGADALPGLADVLERGSVAQRLAVLAVARAHDRADWVALAAIALGDGHSRVRYAAATWAAATFRDLLGGELDRLAHEDPDPDVRFAAS